MLQFYFLSVLLNVVTGLILVYATDFNKVGSDGAVNTASADSPAGTDDAGAPSDSAEGSTESNKESKAARIGKMISSNAFFDDLTFRLVIGILTGLVGIMKLISVVQNDVPVIGDLLPALAGIAGSICMLLEYWKQRSEGRRIVPDAIVHLFENGRKYIGVFCIVAGLLHFVFPKVLFL